MASVVIKTIGTDLNNAELTNAATEQTLSSILSDSQTYWKLYTDTVKKEKVQRDLFNKKFDVLLGLVTTLGVQAASNGSGSSARISATIDPDDATDAAESIASLGETAEAGEGGLVGLFEAVGELVPELEIAAIALAAFEAAVKTIEVVIGTARQLFDAFVDGKNKLSDYTKVLDDGVKAIPIIGGLLGIFTGILNFSIGIFDGWNTTLTSLSTVGASFNNNLMEMRGSAANAGLTLEEFSKIVSDNADNLAQFGNTVTNGAKTFSNVSDISLRHFGQSIMNLAGGWDSYVADLPAVLDLLAPGAVARNSSDQQLAASAFSLSKEMDLMSKLTGQTRAAQLAQVKEQEQSAAFQLKMAQMGPAQIEETNRLMLVMTNKYGAELGGTLVKQAVLGTAAVSDTAKAAQVFLPGLTAGTRALGNMINNASTSTVDFNKQLDVVSNSGLQETHDALKTFSTQVNYAASGGSTGLVGTLANVSISALNYSKSIQNSTGTITQAEEQREQTAAKEQDARDSNREALNNFTLGIREGYESFFVKVIQPISNIIGPVMGVISNLMGQAVNGITGIVKSIVSNVTNFFQSGRFEKALTDVMNWIQTIKFDDIKTVIMNMLEVFDDVKYALTILSGFSMAVKSLYGDDSGQIGQETKTKSSTNNLGQSNNSNSQDSKFGSFESWLGVMSPTASLALGTGAAIASASNKNTPSTVSGAEKNLNIPQAQNNLSTITQTTSQAIPIDNSTPLLKSIDNKLSDMGDAFTQMLVTFKNMQDLLEKNNKHASAIVNAVR